MQKPYTEEIGIAALDETQEVRARTLHRQALIVDACSTAEWEEDYVRRLVASGVRCTWKTLTSHEGPLGAVHDIARWLKVIEKYPDALVPARTTKEIEAVAATGKVAVVYGFQHTKPFEDSIDLIRVFHAMGVRVVQLTYNTRCWVGDGCLEPSDAGLSKFGREVVAELNRLGIIVDLSHVGRRTARDAIDASEAPVVFSHANCHQLIPNPRNVPDDLIKAMAAKGGVIGIAVYLPLLSTDLNKAGTVGDVMAHVDHVVQMVGPQHVGFGLDLGEGRTLAQWDYMKLPPGPYPTWEQREKNKTRGMQRIELFENLTRGLVSKGYRDDDVRAILGGNFMRVFAQVVR